MKKILILDDNITICLMLKSWLTKQGYIAEIASDSEVAMQLIKTEAFDMVISDIRMPNVDGFEFLSRLKRHDTDIIVIMMTSYADIESAVESIKLGAADYIAKPIDPDLLFQKISDAFKDYENRRRGAELKQEFIRPAGVDDGAVLEKVSKIISEESSLFILGAEGTGKSTLAKFIFLKSRKNLFPFTVFDFRFHSFSTSYDSEICRKAILKALEDSKGGTLYMQNLHKPGLSVQTLLIDLFSKKNNDTQILISSSETREELVKNLLPKLSNLLFDSYVELPTLKGNKEAIVSYTEYFLKIANRELNKDIKEIDKEVFEAFYNHDFNLNIQELKNLIFKACLLTDNNKISKDIIPALFMKSHDYVAAYDNAVKPVVNSLRKENFEKQKIEEALEISKGNKTMAASILNIDRKTLYNKIRLYQIGLN